MDTCQRKLSRYCPARIGKDIQKQNYCEQQLAIVNNIQKGNKSEPFIGYKNCMDTKREVVENKCVPSIEGICSSKKTRVIKTVRLGADTIDDLMGKYSNLKIIHLFRDPRPVSLSRIKEDWATLGSVNLIEGRTNMKKTRVLPDVERANTVSNSSWTKILSNKPGTEMGQIAQLYCYQVMRDIFTLKGFTEKYPNRVYQMIFENMASDPIGETEKVYKFIDEPLPKKVVNWLYSNTKGKTNSKHIAEKWQKELSQSTIKDMEHQCGHLFQEVPIFKPT